METVRPSPALEVETDPFAESTTRPLPESIVPLADAYDELVGDRNRSLWRWFNRAVPEFRLSCVDPDRARVAREAKVLATMFITVIDDVAERHGDRETLAELRAVAAEGQNADPTRPSVDADCVRFQQDLWRALTDRFDNAPRGAEFADLLQFDLRQGLQAVDYSALLAQYPGLATEQELWTYDAHNMMVFVFTDIDLANAPSFDAAELGVLRRVVTHAQRMARIGNWIATWERELAEGDCSSGVVVRALETGVVPADELQALRQQPTPARVESVADAIRVADIESYFASRWREEFETASSIAAEVDSVDIGSYLKGFETIFRAQLANRPSN